MGWLDKILRLIWGARAADDADAKARRRLKREAKTAGQIADDAERKADALAEANRDRRP